MTDKKKPAKTTDLSESKEHLCFVLMPFGGRFDQYFEEIYAPAIRDAGLEPKRADDIQRTGTVINDIWTYTQKAKLVLADLTGQNPNVFYELGLAHAIAKPAILVTRSIQEVPFDLRSLRIIQYDTDSPTWGNDLRKQISSAVRETIRAPKEAVLPTFLTVSPSAKPAEISEAEKEVLELRREFEAFRNEVRAFREPLSRPRLADLVRPHSAYSLAMNPASVYSGGLPSSYVVAPEDTTNPDNKL